ncbi:MAG: alpha/beta hydrolase [Sandaracinus sp.]|nr:alpha/beta hydrolase [Myxococcales bacterium]MCB9612066.1 alpha/beta hydrolase [Sandaracinus sp.]
MQMLRHESPDGTSIAVYRWDPSGPARGVVHVSHGMAEHARRYARFAEALTARGFVVYANDHRGHGDSLVPGGALGHMGDDDSFERAVEDLHRMLRDERAAHPGLPVVLFAHSMGSFFGQRLVSAYPSDVDALILSGTNGPPPAIAGAGRVVARVERTRLGKKKPSPLLQKLSFGDFNKPFEGRTEFDWLSRDPAEVDLYVNDPLCGFGISTQSWVDLLDALGGLTKPGALAHVAKALPIYVVSGERDPVGGNGAGPKKLVELYRAAGISDVTLDLLPGARHEVLNETNRDETTAKLVAWLESKLSI